MGFVERDKFGGNEDVVRVGSGNYKSMILESFWEMRVKVVIKVEEVEVEYEQDVKFLNGLSIGVIASSTPKRKNKISMKIL